MGQALGRIGSKPRDGTIQMSRRAIQDEGEEFWPAYADILMVSVLVLVFVVSAFALAPRLESPVPKEIAYRKDVFQSMFKQRLAKEIASGQVALASPEHAERQVITFSDKLLFAVGDANLTHPQGRLALTEVAQLLKDFSASSGSLFARIQVNGHTDEDPIKTPLFPSNWHLSSARATSVVFFLAQNGVNPKYMSSTGFAEQQPFDPFGRPITSKHQKRRIEIEVHYPADWVAKAKPWKQS